MKVKCRGITLSSFFGFFFSDLSFKFKLQNHCSCKIFYHQFCPVVLAGAPTYTQLGSNQTPNSQPNSFSHSSTGGSGPVIWPSASHWQGGGADVSQQQTQPQQQTTPQQQQQTEEFSDMLQMLQQPGPEFSDFTMFNPLGD